MIFPKAKKLAQELDWHKAKSGVFGLYKGYFFNVADASLLSSPQFKYVVATTDALSDEQRLQIKSALDENKKALKFTSFDIEENHVFIQFTENFTYTKIKTVYSLLDFLADLFKQLNIAEQNKCHDCGKNENMKFYNLNDSGIILCSTCLSKIEKNYYEIERAKYLEDKNYLAGFLGSLLFSIPAIIGWVLMAVYLDRLASAMAIIIAFLGLEGYKYFRGRQGKLTKYIMVLSNIISILIANAMTIIALLVNEGLTINQSYTELQINKAVQNLLYENILVSAVLACITWIWLLYQLNDKKLTVKPANK